MESINKTDSARLDAYILAVLQGEMVNRSINLTDELLFDRVYRIASGMLKYIDDKSKSL